MRIKWCYFIQNVFIPLELMAFLQIIEKFENRIENNWKNCQNLLNIVFFWKTLSSFYNVSLAKLEVGKYAGDGRASCLFIWSLGSFSIVRRSMCFHGLSTFTKFTPSRFSLRRREKKKHREYLNLSHVKTLFQQLKYLKNKEVQIRVSHCFRTWYHAFHVFYDSHVILW